MVAENAPIHSRNGRILVAGETVLLRCRVIDVQQPDPEAGTPALVHLAPLHAETERDGVVNPIVISIAPELVEY